METISITEVKSEKREALCVIKDARLGYNADYDRLTLSFSAYQSEGKAAAQSITTSQLEDAIKVTKIGDVKELNNRTCWCEIDETYNTITYLRMFGNK